MHTSTFCGKVTLITALCCDMCQLCIPSNAINPSQKNMSAAFWIQLAPSNLFNFHHSKGTNLWAGRGIFNLAEITSRVYFSNIKPNPLKSLSTGQRPHRTMRRSSWKRWSEETGASVQYVAILIAVITIKKNHQLFFLLINYKFIVFFTAIMI